MTFYRALIVEDQHEVRRMLSASLKTLPGDIEVIEVPSGEEALLIGSRLPMDLLVIDVRLPGMSGLDMLTKLKKRSPNLKVILITGVQDSQTRRQVAEAGADAFFYKPIEMADFLDTVERLLGMVKQAFPLPPVSEQPIAQSAAVRTPLVEEKPTPTLAGRVSMLRQELKILSVVLLDDAGHVLAEAGELPEMHDNEALLSAIMATFSASLKVAHALEMETPRNLLFFAGPSRHICLAPVGIAGVLILVAQDGFQAEQLAAINQHVYPAVKELEAILTRISGAVEPPPAEPVPTQQELVEVVVDPEVLAGVDALFGQAANEQFKQQDVDAFWDALVEQSEMDGSGSADALTYEQARRLGLAPGEEE